MTPFEKIADRYLHDAKFHALVTLLRQEIDAKRISKRDLKQAVRFAIVLAESERKSVEERLR